MLLKGTKQRGHTASGVRSQNYNDSNLKRKLLNTRQIGGTANNRFKGRIAPKSAVRVNNNLRGGDLAMTVPHGNAIRVENPLEEKINVSNLDAKTLDNSQIMVNNQTVGENGDLIPLDNEAVITSMTSNEQNRRSKFDPSKFLSEDFLQILNEHRKNCEREGKLDQATLARKRLKELRIFEEQKRKDETFKRHVS